MRRPSNFVRTVLLGCILISISLIPLQVFAQTPHIDSITPSNGVPGTQVTFNGTGFGASQGGGSVWLSGAAGMVVSWSDTQVIATVSTSATPGVTMIRQNGAWSNQVTFTINPPTLTSITPNVGLPGTQVTFTGSGFGAAQGNGQVWLAGNVAASIVSWSDTQVVATVAQGTQPGQAMVKQYGVWSNQLSFSMIPPTTNSTTPNPAAIGAPVAISGSGFGASQGSGQVWLGSNVSGSILSWSDTQVVATVASGIALGTGNARVKQNGVWSNSTLVTIVAAPAVSSLTPTAGPAGTSVTITGSNFRSPQGTSTVNFNGTIATPSSWSATSITVPVPAGATSGNVVVTVAGGPSNGVNFTVPPPPTLSQLSPTAGPLGTLVTLTGSNFGSTQGGSQALISGLPVSVVSWSNSTITANIPSGVTTGQVLPVTVVTSAGTSNAVQFRAYPPPATGAMLMPSMASMVVGETRTFQATDSSGALLTGQFWLSSDPTIVSLSTDDPPIVTAVAPGQATLTVGDATANITVYPGPFLPTGTVKWSVPGDGSGVTQIVPAVPSSEGLADVFAFQASGKVQAVTSDGSVAWTANSSVINIPDFQGGLLVSDGFSIKKLDGTTGHAYPAYNSSSTVNPISSILVHTDGTVFALDNRAVVLINPKTGVPAFTIQPQPSYTDGGSGNCGEYDPVPHNFPGELDSGIIAGDGYAYFPYTYTVSTDTKSCGSDGSEFGGSHLETHERLLRVGSDGSHLEIVVGDGVVDSVFRCGPTAQAPPGATGECANDLGHSTARSWTGASLGASMITDADQGIVLAGLACADASNPQTCVPQLTTVTTAGSVASASVATGGNTSVSPSLQAADGSYFGTMQVGDISYLSAFDKDGDVRWRVAGDFEPLMATADGGVIARLGTSDGVFRVALDASGNVASQVADTGTVYSWKGSYQNNSISVLSTSIERPSLATSFAAALNGNLAGVSNTSVVHHSFGLFWCGNGFAEQGSCTGSRSQISFSYVAVPSSSAASAGTLIDFSSDHPDWVGVIEFNALRSFQDAFNRYPIIVTLASSHVTGLSEVRDQDYTIFVSGTKWSPAGRTFYDEHSSNVYYLAALEGAETALGYLVGHAPNCGAWCNFNPIYPPTTAQATADFVKLLTAIGKGIGNGAAHEISHHLERVTPNGEPFFPYVDCGVHNDEAIGGPHACENDNDFVYNFWDATGSPQDPVDLTFNGGQFFFVDVPGHSIHWGPANDAWLTKHAPEKW